MDGSLTDKHPNTNKDKEEMFEFSKDVFSFLYFSKVRSRSFFFGVVVFSLQITVLILSMIDLLSHGSYQNKLAVPEYVERPVAISQVLALIISIFMIEDLLYSINAIGLVGYRQELMEKFPEATRIKWYLSHIIRVIMGLMILAVSFLIVVQAREVLDIFKDFSAIHLVGEIDGVAFEVVLSGFFGPVMRKQAIKIEDVKVPESKDRKHWLYFLQIGATLLILIVLLSLWGVIHHRQKDGYYLTEAATRQVQVSFGDEFYSIPANNPLDPNLNRTSMIPGTFSLSSPPDVHYEYFSGLYKVNSFEKKNLLNHRPVYYEYKNTNETAGFFYYCEAEDFKSWVFMVKALNTTIPKGLLDECEYGWLMRSPETEVFSLDQVPKDGWIAWTGKLKKDVTLGLSSVDCRKDKDCGIENGKCNSETRSCECYEGFAGLQCDEREPCDMLSVEYNGSYSSENPLLYRQLERRDVSDDSIRPVLVYDRPAYLEESAYYYLSNSSGCEYLYEIIFYAGGRWYDAVFNCNDIYQLVQDESSFHAYWSNPLRANVKWYSEPTTNFLPIGSISWFQLGDSKAIGDFGPMRYSFPVEQRYDCFSVDCSVTDICGVGLQEIDGRFHGGTCVPNATFSRKRHNWTIAYGKCKCSAGYYGHYCEKSVCDVDFCDAPTISPTQTITDMPSIPPL